MSLLKQFSLDLGMAYKYVITGQDYTEPRYIQPYLEKCIETFDLSAASTSSVDNS